MLLEWRDMFLTRHARLAKRQLAGTPAQRGEFALKDAAPLIRLAELSREQKARSEATYREVMSEVILARQREVSDAARGAAEPESGSDRVGKREAP